MIPTDRAHRNKGVRRSVAQLLLAACAIAACKQSPRPSEAPAVAVPAPGSPRRAIAVVAGAHHTCALVSDGAVRCWGWGADGRLGSASVANIGDPSTPRSGQDVRVGGKVVSLAAGEAHTCALMATGAVRCWGDGAFGQLGYTTRDDVGDNEDPSSVGDVALPEKATAIAAGDRHSCALLASGAVQCWGNNDFEQLGAQPQTFERPVVALATYRASTCVVLDGGVVRCWGAAAGGWGKETLDVDMGTPARGLAPGPGYGRSCAITSIDAVRCWGIALTNLAELGFPKELAVAPLPETGHPTVAQVGDLPATASVTKIALSEHNACILAFDGSVACWGDNADIVGDSWLLGDTIAEQVVLGTKAIDLAMGADHVCVLLDSGGIRCWGRGAGGVLGLGNADDVGPPRSRSEERREGKSV